MAERSARGWFEWLRWGSLGAAALLVVVFLLAQQQSIDVSYGQSPASSAGIKEGEAGELSDATVPSVDEMTAMVAAEPVVRLPGAIAHWDEQLVQEAIGDTGAHILVAPPGLDEQERDRVRDVENATIRVIGTEVSGSALQATADSLAGWRAQFATGDVTGLLVTLLRKLDDREPPPDSDLLRWREPAEAELAAVADDLRATGTHIADGATLTEVPAEPANSAFPGGGALYVALPQQPFGEPVPQYGPALTKLFPDKPIVVLYGAWVEYHGPNAAEFADVVAAGMYGQFGDRLSKYDYPQRNVLNVYLNRVTDARYAGLFDRPLPYQPFDPLRVALPALPWLFAVCVAAFLALSVRSLRPPSTGRPGLPSVWAMTGIPAQLAGLTALAIEMSGLTDRPGNPALTRGIKKLQAAREALDNGLSDTHVRKFLHDAASELDETARSIGRNDYRPAVYLRGRVA